MSDAASAAKLQALEAETTTLRESIAQLQEQLSKVIAQLGLNTNSSAAGNHTTSEQTSGRHELGISQVPELTSDFAQSDAARECGDEAAIVSAVRVQVGHTEQSPPIVESQAGLENPADTPANEPEVVQGTASPDITRTVDNPASSGKVQAREGGRDGKVPPQDIQSPNVGYHAASMQRNKVLPTLKEKGSI